MSTESKDNNNIDGNNNNKKRKQQNDVMSLDTNDTVMDQEVIEMGLVELIDFEIRYINTRYKVHKYILCTQSALLRATILDCKDASSMIHYEIKLFADASEQLFTKFIQMLYDKEKAICNVDIKDLMILYKMAVYFEAPVIESYITAFVAKQMYRKTFQEQRDCVWEYIYLCDLYGLTELKTKCITALSTIQQPFLLKNAKEYCLKLPNTILFEINKLIDEEKLKDSLIIKRYHCERPNCTGPVCTLDGSRLNCQRCGSAILYD